MKTIKTTAKTEETRKALAELITVKLTGSEKQVEWANNILLNAISGIINKLSASIGTGSEIIVSIDDKIITALNMYTDASTIISNRGHYEWANNNSLANLITINR